MSQLLETLITLLTFVARRGYYFLFKQMSESRLCVYLI